MSSRCGTLKSRPRRCASRPAGVCTAQAAYSIAARSDAALAGSSASQPDTASA